MLIILCRSCCPSSSEDTYRDLGKAIHITLDMYSKKPKPIHILDDMYRDPGKAIHITLDMYSKKPKPIHILDDMYRDPGKGNTDLW